MIAALATAGLIFTGTVIDVHDGDTFTLADKTRVRVWGILAVEKGEEGDPAATAALAELVLEKRVICEHKGNSFDRLVARCRVGGIDGLDVGEALLKTRTVTQGCKFSKGAYDAAATTPCPPRKRARKG